MLLPFAGAEGVHIPKIANRNSPSTAQRLKETGTQGEGMAVRNDSCKHQSTSGKQVVVLKRSNRLRSLFRHHRRTTGIQLANPPRVRHTFA